MNWRAPLGTSITILALLLLGFAANLAVLGGLRHARDQRVAYADFREELATATAPTGQRDENGKLLVGGRPVALLLIPQLHLHEVVFEGTTGEILASGPGHQRDTVLPGQPGRCVIMGRRAAYGGPFRDLPGLVRGDQFTVITGQGTHGYRVIGVRVAGDPQPAPVEPGQGRLTLLTADGSPLAPSGIIRVDAELMTKPVETPSRAIAAGGILATELPLAADSQQWMYAVLLGQALLLITVGTVWVRTRWGRWQTWLAAAPVLGAVGLALADRVAFLLPNLT